MSSSEPQQVLESPTLQNLSISSETEEKPLENETPGSKEENASGNGEAVEEEDQEEEEDGECGFCLFMRGGGCKDTFTEWEKCIDEAEKKSEDIVEKCFQATAALKKCMEAHSDYYDPILRAEKAAEEEAVRELEEEAALNNSDVNSGSDPIKKIKEAGDSS